MSAKDEIDCEADRLQLLHAMLTQTQHDQRVMVMGLLEAIKLKEAEIQLWRTKYFDLHVHHNNVLQQAAMDKLNK